MVCHKVPIDAIVYNCKNLNIKELDFDGNIIRECGRDLSKPITTIKETIIEKSAVSSKEII